MLDNISKLYTITLVLLPAINVYRSPIPSVELGTFIILFCTVFFFCNEMRFNKPGLGALWLYLLLVFFICTAISSIIVGYNSIEYRGVFFRYMKIVIIVLALFTIGNNHFDAKLGIKTLKIFSLSCVAYIIIQYIAYYILGIRLIGVVSSLASAEGYAEYVSNSVHQLLYRPCAFFFEPAHFASYSFVYLCWLLTHGEEKHCNLQITFIIIGLLLSTSGTAYAILPVLIIISLMFKAKNGTLAFYNAWKYGVVIVAVGILIVLFFNSEIGSSSLGRLFNDDGSLGGAATGRLQSGAYKLFKELPTVLQFIGCGFGYRPSDVYFPSIYAILYGDGYLGLGLFVILLVIYFVKAREFGKMLCITYAILFIGTGVFNFASIGLYFCLISEETREPEYDSLYQ